MISYVKQAGRLCAYEYMSLIALGSLQISQLTAAPAVYQSGEVVPLEGFVNPKLMSVQVDGIKVIHDGGVAFIPVEKLSVSLQQRYQFDSDVALEMRREEKAKKDEVMLLAALGKRADASRIQIKGVILQVLKDSVILARASYVSGKELKTEEVHTGKYVIGTGPTLFNPDAQGVKEVVTREAWEEVWEKFDDVIAVHGKTDHLVEGQPYNRVVYRCGVVEYTAISGQNKQVAHFTEQRDRSVEFFRTQSDLELSR